MPAPVTDTSRPSSSGAKVPVTVVAWLILTVHVLSRAAQPDVTAPAGVTCQPVNTDPAAGVSRNSTVVASWNSAAHVSAPGHTTPAGELVSVPEPKPGWSSSRV